jgi:hypothetical protein
LAKILEVSIQDLETVAEALDISIIDDITKADEYKK